MSYESNFVILRLTTKGLDKVIHNATITVIFTNAMILKISTFAEINGRRWKCKNSNIITHTPYVHLVQEQGIIEARRFLFNEI